MNYQSEAIAMSKIVAIEIDNENIKIVEGSKSIKGEFMTINKCLSMNVPIGCMDDGKIINLELLMSTIEKALLENGIKTKKAVFVINSNISTRKMELPLLKRKSDTLSMIKFELEQLLDYNFNHIVIFKTSEIINIDCTNTKRAKYIVYGLSVNVYNQYIKLSKMLKLKLIAIDISSNFIEKIPKQKIKINNNICLDGINAFVNISYDSIVFCVINKGINEFSKIIYLNSESYKEELYEIYRVAENSNYMNTKTSSKEFNTNKWLDEISKYIGYYYSIDNDNVIDKIYIYGTCYEIDSLEQYFQLNLGVNVEIIKELSNFKIENLFADINIIEYFHVALALYVNRNDINFLTDKIHNHKFKFNLGVAVMVTFLFFVLTLAFFTQKYLVYYELLEKEIGTMSWYVNKEENIDFNNEIESLKHSIDCLEEYNVKAIKVKEIISGEDVVNSKIFREIANAKPYETKITFIVVDKSNIHMQCTSPDMEDIMLFLKNLAYVSFIDSTYIPIVDVKQEGEYVLSYSLICKLRGHGVQ